MLAAYDKIPRPVSLDEVPSVAAREMEVRAAAIERIRALEPPEELRGEASRFLSDLDRKQDLANQAKIGAEREDGAEMYDIEQMNLPWHERFVERNREMGLDECTNI